MGSWLLYGLGSECDNLPGFVVLTSTGQVRPGAADRRAAVAQRLSAEPVPGRRVPLQGRSGAVRQQSRRRDARAAARRRRQRSQALNRLFDKRAVDDPEIATRITPVRDGLPHADERAGVDGPLRRAARRRSTCTAPRAATARSRPTVCWPAGWPSAACGSSSSITATGTITAT